MADRSSSAKARHGDWIFILATAEPPDVALLKSHALTRKDAWPNFTRFLIAVGTRWGTWGEDIRPSLDRIETATGVDRSKASRWLGTGVSLGYLSITREGSRGVATIYRIAIPGERYEKAAHAAPRKTHAPMQPRTTERPSAARARLPVAPRPKEAEPALSWGDLPSDAQAVFFWPAAEREKRWKSEYGDFQAATTAALAYNPHLSV